MMKKIALAVCAMLLVGSVAAQAGPNVGETIPADVETSTMTDAAPVKLMSLVSKDNFTAIVFMNTACSACMQEMTSMMALAEETKKLAVVPISVDVKGKEAVERFIGTYPQFKDLKFGLDPKYALAGKFGFFATPASLIVDGKGKVLARMNGWNPENDAAAKKVVKGK